MAEPRRWRGWALVVREGSESVTRRRRFPYCVCESEADAIDLQDPGEEIVVVEVVELEPRRPDHG